jgi:hypothetical protein
MGSCTTGPIHHDDTYWGLQARDRRQPMRPAACRSRGRSRGTPSRSGCTTRKSTGQPAQLASRWAGQPVRARALARTSESRAFFPRRRPLQMKQSLFLGGEGVRGGNPPLQATLQFLSTEVRVVRVNHHDSDRIQHEVGRPGRGGTTGPDSDSAGPSPADSSGVAGTVGCSSPCKP